MDGCKLVATVLSPAQAQRLQSDPWPGHDTVRQLAALGMRVCCQPVPMLCSLDVFFLLLVDVVGAECGTMHTASTSCACEC